VEAQSTKSHNWRESLAIYAHPRVVTFLFLGFSAGLPFLLVFSTLSAWLKRSEISLATIGFASWIGITYSIKFVWSPVVDRVPLPLLTRWLGRRRSWMLLAQTGIGLGLLLMSFCDPREELGWLVAFAVVVAFSSATQDIALDALRIEATDETLQGATAATYQLGYRIAVLAASAGALYVAAFGSWPLAYLVMSALALVGITTTLLIAEPEKRLAPGTAEREGKIAEFAARHARLPPMLRDAMVWIYAAIVCPFVDFFVRFRWIGLLLLAFIGLFRLSDIAMGVMAYPFYLSLGFDEQQIANVSKIYGFVMTSLGALLGGTLVFRLGASRLLAVSVFLIAASNLTFAWLAALGRADTLALTVAISIDNLVSGMAGSVFIAFLSGLTNTAYTATQYALFSSIMTLPGKVIGGFSGVIVERLQAEARDVPAFAAVLDAMNAAPKFAGFALFFIYTALLGLPALVMAFFVRRHFEKETPPSARKEGQ
jgi:MFS transporter, PAT family, beta-lactamase induction signal transducer AmpG